jgi:hypothetical protein
MALHDNLANTEMHIVVDTATLYLFQRGYRWVVAVRSPRLCEEIVLDEYGDDPEEAQYKLLYKVGCACPGVIILNESQILSDSPEPATDTWEMHVSRVEYNIGDLGIALHHALAGSPASPLAAATVPPVHSAGPDHSAGLNYPTRCPEGRSPKTLCRPLSF